mmetsp:Transcript_109356/g.193707  ORF Transcript_109356/g.193707 Transcript_109356/m.193707 type:complete len:358 (+) Transcript_109356:221-1294(+)
MTALCKPSRFVPAFMLILFFASAPAGEAVLPGAGALGAQFGRGTLRPTSAQDRQLADQALEGLVMQEDALEEFADDIDDDESAFMGFQRPAKLTNPGASSQAEKPSTSRQEADEAFEPQGEGWEAQFALGLHESKLMVAAEELSVGAWATDRNELGEGSGAGVPAQMLKAEALMLAAETAPADSCKVKTAERALRLYYHARWLAERNYASAAEWRYAESARLARRSRRSVLASHSLARLGYFLIQWNRPEEAREVLAESMQLNMKSNPLAPYLYGVLERQAAGADLPRLLAAEEHIIQSGEQPSEDLELERHDLIAEISYWRDAEVSSKHCLANSDVAHVLICLCGHAAQRLSEACR